jgi:hypothetical protein
MIVRQYSSSVTNNPAGDSNTTSTIAPDPDGSNQEGNPQDRVWGIDNTVSLHLSSVSWVNLYYPLQVGYPSAN